jgi:hypothetical protein
MENHISVSKASRLLGIDRAELNEQLRAANIPTFEGTVDFDLLKSVAPEISFCEEDIINRMRYIREDTTKRDRRMAGDKSLQELKLEVDKLHTKLMVETRSADHYERILVDLARKLGELQASDNAEVRTIGASLCEWLRVNVRD